MKRIVLVQTSPAGDPGSMSAYAGLVQAALSAGGGGDMPLEVMPFHAPHPGSMWAHHLWRIRHAGRMFSMYPEALFHLLDGSMAGMIPRRFLDRTIVTVHDLIPALQLRGELPGRQSLAAGMLVRRGLAALARARALCADSEITRRDVERLAGRGDATVIPLAVRPLPDTGTNDGHDLPGTFLFHVGNNGPYKNRPGVLEVFARLQDLEHVHLVMAGPPVTPEVRERARALRRVILLEQVDDALLSRLYRRAALLLFPSLYEGFGMPVLEAMSVGCPVVCTSAGSLGEVTGEAALVASPDDPEELAKHCREVLTRPGLREDLASRGRTHASRYSLVSMGKAMSGWYRNCLHKGELL